jgi:pentose-5-phosphate-3-epimerase
MIEQSGRTIALCVDGGITRDNIARMAGAGVDLVVTGSAVFDGKAPLANANYMLQALRSEQPA